MVFDYRPVLEEAIEAARRAGAILRAERRRDGGPRGPMGSCPADTEAEEAIRAHLRACHPDWQFFGEETGTTGGPSEHHWLVDPNDGTRPFQYGARGAAVSIGLLRGTEVVLGVVFAPDPPRGTEDLITWALGAGPVQRNGVAVQRRWADVLSGSASILVSHTADLKATANAELVAPARFRAMPSIAYRLALAAVGEAEVAISLVGAEDYDYAGAHAILIGAGGVLLDRNGEPVTYASEGGRQRSGGGRVFGGSPAIAAELARRDWTRVKTAARNPKVPRVWPRVDRIVHDLAVLDRAQGVLLGQLAGDALGAQVEFMSEREIARRYPDGVRDLADGGYWRTLGGQPTDDSELALALARALLGASEYEPAKALANYVAWMSSEPFDVGSTTTLALPAARSAARDPLAAVAKAASQESQANGALMRVSPLGIFGSRAPADRLAEWARADAALTHPHPVCAMANEVFVCAIAAGVRGADAEQAFDAARARVDGRPDAASVAVRDRLHEARRAPPGHLDSQNRGWVLLALHNAFHQLLHAPSVEAGLIATVKRGGDSDTNGAIAGALLGAVHGAQSFPFRWVDRVLTCRALEGSATAHPRPPEYWPVDALVLAERLVGDAPE